MELIRLLGWKRLVLVAGIVATISAPFVYSMIELAPIRARRRPSRDVHLRVGQSLAPGVHVQRVGPGGTLGRLGYTETRTAPPSPGHFRRSGGSWDIYLRGGDLRGGDEAAGGCPARASADRRRPDHEGHARGSGTFPAPRFEPEVLSSATDRPGEDHKARTARRDATGADRRRARRRRTIGSSSTAVSTSARSCGRPGRTSAPAA